MKFTCQAGDLAYGFQLMAGVVLGKTPRTTLSGVKIEAESDHVKIFATDSEIAISYALEKADVQEPGQCLIPITNIAGVLRETEQGGVTVQSQENECRVTCSDGSFRVQGEDPHKFPFIPFIQSSKSLLISRQTLTDAIRKTIFAAAKEKSRYALNGILVAISGTSLDMVATDGKRLAKIGVALGEQANVAQGTSAIIPKKALELFERTGGADCPVKVELEESIVQLSFERIVLCAKLVEGIFPNWNEVVPAKYTRSIGLQRQACLSGIRRAALFCSQESRAITLRLLQDQMEIQGRSEIGGEAVIRVPIAFSGEPLEIAVNPEFMEEVFRVVSEEELLFEFAEPNRPVLIRSKDGAYLNVIMPISPGS